MKPAWGVGSTRKGKVDREIRSELKRVSLVPRKINLTLTQSDPLVNNIYTIL